MPNFTNGDDQSVKIKPIFTIGAEAADVITVSIQLVDRQNGGEITEHVGLMWYLSADANGNAIGTAPSGGTAAGTDGLLIEWTANLAGMVISEADGDIDIAMTEAGALTNYLVLVMPDGKLYVSGAITHAA
jgi:hypothetical protein